ncbi:putative ABC transporter substrate-binding protein [Megalodesulfovibrio gigas DSM 1382 = ATCC 19364]|uniref:Putative ABC transporter substrate-binding protein n=2 Tax=Megalodesulfovibrio gigas TaxID=879 RepID=T2GB67_MEGG1|nr:putative ABC transporter substrate-binding protein [Megalodesulfovibrio gigas DSM 1382 = ATCC 19364]
MLLRCAICLAVLWACAMFAVDNSALLAFDRQILKIYYYIRPPYYVEDGDGGVRGLTADPVLRAAALAHVPLRWEVLPPAQHLPHIQANAGPACALGWFKTPEREHLAKFSAEIYRDAPFVGLARQNAQAFADQMTLDQTMSNSSLTLLVKESFSYGEHVDTLIRTHRPRRVSTFEENIAMLHMIQNGQADYMLLAPEEAEHLFTLDAFSRNAFRILHFPDVPPGNSRHLMCTRATPDSLLERLNLGLRGIPSLP